jgi:cob(I)alamin adenosyltransferase
MLGRGGRVYICQFLKPADQVTGEALSAERFSERLTLERLEEKWDLRPDPPDPQQVRQMRSAIAEKLIHIRQIVKEGHYDLVILDELVLCLKNGLADRENVWVIIDERPTHMELVLTGRGADDELIKRADLVTKMEDVKHPYQQGAGARKGIEY